MKRLKRRARIISTAMTWCRLSTEEHNMKMKRRDFNRIALGMGLSPLLGNSPLAEAMAQTKGGPPTPPENFNIVIKTLHEPTIKLTSLASMSPESGGSVFIGPGAIRGSPIAT